MRRRVRVQHGQAARTEWARSTVQHASPCLRDCSTHMRGHSQRASRELNPELFRRRASADNASFPFRYRVPAVSSGSATRFDKTGRLYVKPSTNERPSPERLLDAGARPCLRANRNLPSLGRIWFCAPRSSASRAGERENTNSRSSASRPSRVSVATRERASPS